MKKLTGISLFIFFAVVTAVLTAGLVFYQSKQNNNFNSINSFVGNNSSLGNLNTNLNNSTKNFPNDSILDKQEVAKHSTISDCWIIVNNKVYNISGYASSHPGGTRNIANYCGKESTNAFDTKGGNGSPHSSSANQQLSQFFVGNLNQSVSQTTINASVQKAKTVVSSSSTGGEYEDD